MLTQNTPERLAELCQTLDAASTEIYQLLSLLSSEADASMASAAEEFSAAYSDTEHGPLYASYAQAHDGLLKAAVCASNLRELAGRANTLRSKVSWWSGSFSGKRQPSDIATAMELMLEPKSDSATRAFVGHLNKQGWPGAYFLSQNWADLPGGEWIAAGKDGLIAHDPSRDKVIEALISAAIEPEDTVLIFKSAESQSRTVS